MKIKTPTSGFDLRSIPVKFAIRFCQNNLTNPELFEQLEKEIYKESMLQYKELIYIVVNKIIEINTK